MNPKPWEKCGVHGMAQPNVWACPKCLIELRRDRDVLARWMAEALLTLGTLTEEDSEDGGESLRLLIQRGQRLVDAVLRHN